MTGARDNSTTTAVVRLPYEAKSRKRRWLRPLLITLMVLAIGSVIGAQRYRIMSKLELLLLQKRCMEYSDLCDAPVFANYAEETEGLRHVTLQMQRLEPRRPEFLGTAYGRVPQAWHRFLAKLPPQEYGLVPHGMVYLGRLRSNGGTERLIAVNIAYAGAYPTCIFNRGGLAIEVDAIEPEGVFKSCVRRQYIVDKNHRSAVGAEDCEYFRYLNHGFVYGNVDLQIYPGVAVPKDPSSFHAKVTVGKEHGELVGKLLDDGTVQLSVNGLDKLRAE